MKKPVAIGVVLAVVVAFLLWYSMGSVPTFPTTTAVDYKTIPYLADNQPATFFGNEAVGDLNGDGMPDVALILTQSGGGSGTFYYVAVALKTAQGYQATNAVFLGDRIAPQSTEIQEGRVVVNYADRKPGEPMTATPSIGISKYLVVEGTTLVAK